MPKPISRREFVMNSSVAIAGTCFIPPFLNLSIKLSKMDNTQKTYSPSNNTSDILIDKLIAWDVEVIFALVGDGINPIFEALRKRSSQIKLITVRHEESAAFMASGYS